MIIRPYTPNDLQRVLDITLSAWESIFTSFYALLGPEIFKITYPDWRDEKRKSLTSQCSGKHGETVHIAEEDGYVVGFIVYYCNVKTTIGEISHNAVDPTYQNQGIATAMYTKVLSEMKDRGMTCALVSTGGDSSHAPARCAYEKAGFKNAIPSVNYYQVL